MRRYGGRPCLLAEARDDLRIAPLETATIEELGDRAALSLISPMPIPWLHLIDRLARTVVDAVLGGQGVTVFSGAELDAA